MADLHHEAEPPRSFDPCALGLLETILGRGQTLSISLRIWGRTAVPLLAEPFDRRPGVRIQAVPTIGNVKYSAAISLAVALATSYAQSFVPHLLHTLRTHALALTRLPANGVACKSEQVPLSSER